MLIFEFRISSTTWVPKFPTAISQNQSFSYIPLQEYLDYKTGKVAHDLRNPDLWHCRSGVSQAACVSGSSSRQRKENVLHIGHYPCFQYYEP